MTDLIDTVQLQEIDQGYVELFDFTLPSGTVVHLFKGLEDGTESIWFPSKDGTQLNEYIAIPLELTGIEITSSGASTRPTLSMANIPSLTRTLAANETTLSDIAENEVEILLSGEGIYNNEDFLGTAVEYRSTLTNYLKQEGDTAALPVEFPSHKFVIDRITAENNILVQFELATVFDLEGIQLPYRQINGRYCPWQYQGHALSNQGGCTWPLDSRNRFYDKNDNLLTIPSTYDNTAKNAGDTVKTVTNGHTQIWEAVTNVPPNKDPQVHGGYWKRLDVCGKLISSCKVRFQGPDEDTSKELPFGGFPGTRKFK